MANIYYNSTRTEILKRLKYLNEKKYVDFFRESTPFMLSLYLTYFGLAEDIMIERDSKDYNINTRFTKHIDDTYLKKVFPAEIPIEYIVKEKDGNSMKWILSTLRNGIFHNGPEVNYKDKKIIVKNEGFLNKLECIVPFNWFENFIHENIVEHIELDNYTYHIFIPPFNTKNVKWIQTYDDINKYIEKELHGIVINISLDKSSNNQTKIKRNDFLARSNSISNKFYNLYYNDSSDPINEKFNLLKEKIESELIVEKSNLTNTEYEKLVYFKMFKEFYTNEFKNKYPNYNISINKFENNNYAESLFKRGRDRIQFFKRENPHFQGIKIANLLSDRFNHDKTNYLSKIYYLCSLYDFCSKAITTEYQTDKYMEKIVNQKYRTNNNLLEEEYARVIKNELENKGILLSYDKQITNSIIWGMNMYDEDIYLRCRELTNNYSGDINSTEYFEYIKEKLKKEFPNYYEELSAKYTENGICYDQVWDIFKSHNLYALNNAKGLLIQNRDDIIEALLYTLGINTYVMNKETYLKDLNDEDYSFMDKLYFKGYSHDLYNNDIAIIKQKRSEYKSRQKRLTKSLNGLQIGLTKSKDADDINKKQQDIVNQTTNLNLINNEILKCDSIINNTEIIDVDNRNLQKTSNSLCASIIRNCFAHCDRVHITGRDKYGETLLTLTDYDNNGQISGIVKTNLTSLIGFLTHDILKNAINKEEEIENNTKSTNIYFKKEKI